MNLLNLLPPYKRLAEQMRTLASAKTLSDDEVRRLRARVEDLQSQLSEALTDGRKAREQVTDWIATFSFGRPVFGPGGPMPEPPDIPSSSRRMHGRDLVRKIEREILSELHGPTADPQNVS